MGTYTNVIDAYVHLCYLHRPLFLVSLRKCSLLVTRYFMRKLTPHFNIVRKNPLTQVREAHFKWTINDTSVTYDSGQQLAPNCEYQNRNFLHRHIRNLEFLDFRRVLQKPVYLRYHSRKDLLLILMPNHQLIMIQPLGSNISSIQFLSRDVTRDKRAREAAIVNLTKYKYGLHYQNKGYN